MKRAKEPSTQESIEPIQITQVSHVPNTLRNTFKIGKLTISTKYLHQFTRSRRYQGGESRVPLSP